jgi:hypothetical protein
MGKCSYQWQMPEKEKFCVINQLTARGQEYAGYYRTSERDEQEAAPGVGSPIWQWVSCNQDVK